MISETINAILALPGTYLIIGVIVGAIIWVVCILNKETLQKWDIELPTLFLFITFLAIGWPVVILALTAGCIGGIAWSLGNLLAKGIRRLLNIENRPSSNSWETIDVSDKKCSYRECSLLCSYLILQTTTTGAQLGESPRMLGACEKHRAEIEGLLRDSLGSIHKVFKVENGQATVYPRFWELR